jgi:hypothetical protein
MRFLLTLIMTLGMFAGLNAGVLALDCGSDDSCRDVAESCCVEVHDTSVSRESHHEGDGCPVEHHHHYCCSHGLMLGIEGQVFDRLGAAESVILQLRPEADVLPEAPFLGSEKPPLI